MKIKITTPDICIEIDRPLPGVEEEKYTEMANGLAQVLLQQMQCNQPLPKEKECHKSNESEPTTKKRDKDQLLEALRGFISMYNI